MPPKRQEPNREKDYQTMVRTSADDKATLHALANHYGISMSDTVVMLVREKIRKEGIVVRPLDHYR